MVTSVKYDVTFYRNLQEFIVNGRISRTHLINPARGEDIQPQGLKPNGYTTLAAQLKLCPFKTIYEMTSNFSAAKPVIQNNN